MKRFRLSLILFAIASLGVITAICAAPLGLDRSPGWGRGRLLFLFVGVLLFFVAAVIHFWGSSFRPFAILLGTVGRLRERASGFLPPHSPHIVGIAAGVLVTGCVGIYVLWYSSAGRFPSFPYIHNDYADLGEAFLHGQLSLLEIPGPELQALRDPYELSQRADVSYRWDASYYRGRYYLYWGPVPAVVSAGMQVVIGMAPSGALLVALAYLLLLAIFPVYLSRIWMRLYPGRLMFSPGLIIAVAFVNLPLLFELGQSRVYEASILYGQLFLLVGLLCWELYTTMTRPAWLVAAGLAWGLAMGCRYNLLISVVIFLAFAMTWIARRRERGQLWRHTGLLVAPLILSLMVGGIYNYLRFDNPFETGYALQLTVPAQGGFEYSPSFLPSSFYIYLFYPLTMAGKFPFVKSALFDPNLVPGWLQMPSNRVFDHVLFGTFPAAPYLWLLVLAAVPLAHTLVRWRRANNFEYGPHFEWNFRWGMLGAAAAAQFLFIAMYYYAAERFVGDFYLLSVLTVALAVRRIDGDLHNRMWLRGILRVATLTLAIWTVSLGFFGAFGVPPKTMSTDNPALYARLASYWNDRFAGIQAVIERVNEVIGLEPPSAHTAQTPLTMEEGGNLYMPQANTHIRQILNHSAAAPPSE